MGAVFFIGTIMRTTLLVTVLVILHLVSCAGKKPHEKLTDKLKCMCDCDAATDPKMCDCKCQQPKTICAPGYSKVCPEMDGKCGKDTKTPLCPADIFGLLESSGRALDNWVVVKEVEERKPEIGAAVRSPRKKQRWTGVEVKCDKIPKFKCDFIVDYAPGEVTDFKAAKCTHRKNIKKCPITLETDDGCTIKAFLYNKQKDIFTKGRIAIECDWTTTAAPTTTPGATTTDPEALPPVEAVGDGCTCVPDFAMNMLASGIVGATGRNAGKEDRKRGRVTQEVRCEGIPKFKCDFIYDYEPCSRINEISANKCNHRKDVKKCPIKLETKDGCIINALLTNKGAKMIVGKSKIKWGDNPLTGFMSRCVCLPDLMDSVSV